MFDQNTQADDVIGEVVNQIAAEPGVLAILLAGSRANGTAWPGSDFDLLVIVEEGPSRRDTFEVGGLGFDIYRDTLQGLEVRMAADGIACHRYLELVPLVGGEEWKRRLEETARRTYARHVPGPEELQKMRSIVRSAARSLRMTLGGTDRVAQAVAGGDLVWISAKVCLGIARIGPLREAVWSGDAVRQALEAAVIVWFAVPACLSLAGIVPPPHKWWQAALRHAELPFDAAALHARALTGKTLAERTEAALELGRLTLDALKSKRRNTDG